MFVYECDCVIVVIFIDAPLNFWVGIDTFNHKKSCHRCSRDASLSTSGEFFPQKNPKKNLNLILTRTWFKVLPIVGEGKKNSNLILTRTRFKVLPIVGEGGHAHDFARFAWWVLVGAIAGDVCNAAHWPVLAPLLCVWCYLSAMLFVLYLCIVGEYQYTFDLILIWFCIHKMMRPHWKNYNTQRNFFWILLIQTKFGL